jgi:DnaJ-class molecular chaperone
VSKEDAEKDFRRIATAYEILSDNASREDYDYMVAW